MAPNCPYEVLGVKRGSVDKEIKDAYRSLVLKYHPDKFANASEHQRIQAKRKFQEIAEAFETLGDRASRNRYDSRGFGHRHGAGHYNNGGSAGSWANPTSAYTYKSGWHQFSRRNNVKGTFFSTFARLGAQEAVVMAGLVSLVIFGTSAVDSTLTSMWNSHNEGKLYKDITREEGRRRKEKAEASRRRRKSESL